MAIPNGSSANLLRFNSRVYVCFSLRNFWRFLPRDSEDRAIRDSRFCSAKALFKISITGSPEVCPASLDFEPLGSRTSNFGKGHAAKQKSVKRGLEREELEP